MDYNQSQTFGYFFGVKGEVLTKDAEYEIRLRCCNDVYEVYNLIQELFDLQIPPEFIWQLSISEYHRIRLPIKFDEKNDETTAGTLREENK